MEDLDDDIPPTTIPLTPQAGPPVPTGVVAVVVTPPGKPSVPAGPHPVRDTDGTGAHHLRGGTHGGRWSWVPRPTGISGLEDWCLWLNFLDGLMTTHALAGGRYVELNVLMERAWRVSPLLYGTLKFWLFWLGLKLLERAAIKRGSQHVRERVLHGIFAVFLLVIVWHLRVLSLRY